MHPKLKKIHPFLSVLINMYGSGEVVNDINPLNVKLEFDRNKIDYFTVIVELAII